jgi:hypothetical protein
MTNQNGINFVSLPQPQQNLEAEATARKALVNGALKYLQGTFGEIPNNNSSTKCNRDSEGVFLSEFQRETQDKD